MDYLANFREKFGGEALNKKKINLKLTRGKVNASTWKELANKLPIGEGEQ